MKSIFKHTWKLYRLPAFKWGLTGKQLLCNLGIIMYLLCTSVSSSTNGDDNNSIQSLLQRLIFIKYLEHCHIQ